MPNQSVMLLCDRGANMIIYDRIAIGNRAYSARTNKNIKQSEMGEALNIHQSTYSKFENGRYDIPLSELIKLCNYLDISMSWLIGENITQLTENEFIELEQYRRYLINKRNK